MPSERCIVTFEPSGDRAEVAEGVTLHAAALLAGAAVAAPCGGMGVCGGCAVSAVGDLDEPGPDERTVLSQEALATGVRLACRARVRGDVTVRPLRSVPPAELRIVESGDLREISVEPPERRGVFGPAPLLGAAVDVGTTTVAVSLVDLRTGEPAGSASAVNPQIEFGDDVISRIARAAEVGTEPLRGPVVRTVEDLALGLLAGHGLGIAHLGEVAIAGNPTMLHLLLGIDPAPLGAAPYEPARVGAVDRTATAVGFTRLGRARAYVLPGISAFLGADVTAGLLTTRLAEHDTPTLFVDLGTNGEVVLRTQELLIGASTAAGPALEGASIGCGMRAETGAVERVTLEDDGLVLGTIGDAPPAGLCGSGVIDLVATLLDAGVLDATGLLHDDAPHPLAGLVSVRNGVRVFEVAPGVLFTQKDVRQVQLAAAAVSTGIAMLLEAAELTAGDVTGVVVGGGFGLHVRGEALARIGAVPPEWRDRVTFAGNTAIAGATRALLDRGQRRLADAIAHHVGTLDLAARPDFGERFVRALDFPAR